MKNQYVGDVGDYGKYGMLRFFARKGIRVGVNWYLTKNDGSKDGKHITYLNNTKDKEYDGYLYEGLKYIAFLEDKSVQMIENAHIIPDGIFYSDVLESEGIPMEERKSWRRKWHEAAVSALQDCELVFLDPDNGPIGSKTAASKSAEKYVAPEEICDYYRLGKNVVYYCQKARRTPYQWEKVKYEMNTYLPDAKINVITFHRGTQRSYIFVIHPECYEQYKQDIDDFMNTKWHELFSVE